MSEEQVCEAVKGGLRFVDAYVVELTDAILYSEEVDPVALSKALHRKLRCSLPVPVIYTVLRMLERLGELGRIQKDAMDAGEKVVLPSSKTSVDYTLKKVFRKWNAQVSKFVHSNSDFQSDDWDPSELVLGTLELVAKDNLGKFFGIE